MDTTAPNAPREKTFLLAAPEARLLTAIAGRLPARLLPDHLTILGLLGAIGTCAAYVASNDGSSWLWVASALLVVQWLGDSLDGTVARTRRTEHPNYGYYVDHLADAFATSLIGVGLGLSPFALLATGLAIVVAYLALSINTSPPRRLPVASPSRHKMDYRALTAGCPSAPQPRLPSVIPATDDGLPQHGNVVGAQRVIRGDDRDPELPCLGYEQPVERIVVMER